MYVRLKGKPELLTEYNAIFREQLRAGIIEQVPVSRENDVGVHFMPHHGVVQTNRETSKLVNTVHNALQDSLKDFEIFCCNWAHSRINGDSVLAL